MRVSNYVIAAPLAGQASFVLMHGYTGAVDKIASHLGQALLQQRGGEFDCAGWPESLVDRLRTRGYLTDLTGEEERQRLIQLTAQLHALDLAGRAGIFVIVPTYICNLRCPYCFQGHDMHAGEGRFGNVMTVERVDQLFAVIDRFKKPGSVAAALGVLPPGIATEDASLRQPELTLFGGEPLLEITVPSVSAVVDRAAGRGMSVGAITNGVELALFEHLLGPGLIDSLQITIDGPPEVHDCRRIGPTRKKTFETIADNVQRALDHGASVAVRINVDGSNAAGLAWLEEDFARRGWSDHPSFIARAAEVHAGWAPNHKRKMISGSQLIQLTRRDTAKADENTCIESYEGTARRVLLKCLRAEGYPFRATTFCGAEAGMMIFDPLGDVYACWEQIGHRELRIAEYDAEGIRFDHAQASSWLNRYPGTIDECSRCPYALIHTSGCAQQAWFASGTIFAPACESFKEYFPRTLADAYLQIESAVLAERVDQEGPDQRPQ